MKVYCFTNYDTCLSLVKQTDTYIRERWVKVKDKYSCPGQILFRWKEKGLEKGWGLESHGIGLWFHGGSWGWNEIRLLSRVGKAENGWTQNVLSTKRKDGGFSFVDNSSGNRIEYNEMRIQIDYAVCRCNKDETQEELKIITRLSSTKKASFCSSQTNYYYLLSHQLFPFHSSTTTYQDDVETIFYYSTISQPFRIVDEC